MEPDRKYYTILDFSKTKRGWIQYNVFEDEDVFKDKDIFKDKGLFKDKDLFKERYIITKKKFSKDKDKIKDRDRLDVKEYYILVVRPTSVDSEYRRIRVGLIKSDYVVRQRLNMRVV